VRVLLVGNGAPHYIDAFLERQDLSDKNVTVVTDPTLRSHQAAQLDRSSWATIGPRAVKDAVVAFARGYRQTGIEGDRLQQGGVVLLDREGKVAFHHSNPSLGAHADAAKLLEAARSLG
jgi:hypothetical protein